MARPGSLPETCKEPGGLQAQLRWSLALWKAGEADWVTETAFEQRVTLGNARVFPMINEHRIELILFTNGLVKSKVTS